MALSPSNSSIHISVAAVTESNDPGSVLACLTTHFQIMLGLHVDPNVFPSCLFKKKTPWILLKKWWQKISGEKKVSDQFLPS